MAGGQIAQDSMVEVHYRLLDEQGDQVDSSEADEPLRYVHGYGQILPGLERELEGRAEGEQATITVPPEDGAPRNVILIAIDTLRADRLGSYGCGRPTSPNIDALAEDGVRFDQVASNATWTCPSFASILTGIPGLRFMNRPMSTSLASSARARRSGISRTSWPAARSAGTAMWAKTCSSPRMSRSATT